MTTRPADGDTGMHLPERAKKFEWNFNTIIQLIGLVVTLAAMLIGGAIGYAALRASDERMQDEITGILTRMSEAEEKAIREDAKAETERKERMKIYQDQLLAVQTQISQIPPLTFNTTRALEAAADGRRATDTLGTKLDTLADNVNKLSSQVMVVTSKLDDLRGSAQKMYFKMPIMKQGMDEKREAFDAAPGTVGAKLARQ